ncbi:hypothetical protein VTJ83DRAFT_1001 [Remersonia thermophila]|uniref:USP domain-containing protein n=1 Tax=Remersonia thermophila TaxID=72144 RepID=A0ABR4DMW4_9PEZI
MAQASTVDPPRERAVSSEPCSTRPNPFHDDDDSSSRKRRRTSLASGSRSRSVDTPRSSPSSSAKDTTPITELRSDSAMRLDSEPPAPATPKKQQQPPPPQQQQPQSPSHEPASAPRSSRVTINVRTPSQQPLEAIPSSPSSPCPEPFSRRPATPDPDDAAVAGPDPRQPDETMEPANGAAEDVSEPARSDSGSPPIEVVSVSPDEDADFDDDDSITMFDEAGRTLDFDPSIAFPFHDGAESYFETVLRLLQYLPTHEQVPRAFIEWIDKYLGYIKAASPRAIDESYFSCREMWQPVPQLLLHMVSRKNAYPRSKDMRQDIFAFYRSFAQLTAFFVELDLRLCKNPSLSDQARLEAFASPPYLHALGAITRREEVQMHTVHLRAGDEDWNYISEITAVLDAFQGSSAAQGGSLANLRQLAAAQLRLAAQFPRAVTENLGSICLVAGNVTKYLHRGAAPMSGRPSPLDLRDVARLYSLFTTMSALLSEVLDKNLNQLSSEAAGYLIEGLTEIYQTCLATGGVVPPGAIDKQLQGRPAIPPQHAAEAIAYDWKFGHFIKLIRSGQMQLRVMAVSTMCTDLVALYRKSAVEPGGDDASLALLHYMAEVLLSSGLISYILGPTCHPEITLESSNIIGFLVVSNTYTRAHTDILWQTVSSTQDPRVSDALLRMIGRIANLFPQEPLLYFVEKLATVPMEAFGPTMREFCDQILKQFLTRFADSLPTEPAPFDLCIRLVQQASRFGTQTAFAYPDVHQFANQKLLELLGHGPDTEGRWNIYRNCLRDIATPSPTTLGSLWVLKMAMRYHHAYDLHELASDHDLTRLLVEELAAAIPAARAAGFPAVISGGHNTPRKDLLMSVMLQEASSIDKELGKRLWNLLVGPEAACQEDREVAWQILTQTMKRSKGENPFTSTCFAEYFPALDPSLFCQGALDFVCGGVMPLVNDPASIVLDDDDNPHHAGIEMLWRIALTAPPGTIEDQAIHVLAGDVYINSGSIRSFSHYRARKVHLALVSRCLRQLSAAAAKLKAAAPDGGAAAAGDDAMDIVLTEQQRQECERLFARALAVLREFHRLHQARPEFSAPDMRSLILESPKHVEGESAELKYQSFDGDRQTSVMPLNIGKRNTAASLLASLREVTGFESYRIYYRGRPFVPQESDICRSLEDLQIHNGIILVKREPDETPASPRVPLGASPVEVEILSHFDELWEYLSMDERLARQIYGFLVKLPADDSVVGAINDTSLSYVDTFPLGQPFKSLYAVHALLEHLGSWRRGSVASASESQAPAVSRAEALVRAMDLVVQAILDPQVIARCPTQELQVELGSALLQLYSFLLKDPGLPKAAAQSIEAPLLDRLLEILAVGVSSDSPQTATKHISLCLQSILESCCVSDSFASAFSSHPNVSNVVIDLLFRDPRPLVRKNAALLICQATRTIPECERYGSYEDFLASSGLLNSECFTLPSSLLDSDSSVARFRGFFWPLVSGLVRPAVAESSHAVEIVRLCYDMFKGMRGSGVVGHNLETLVGDIFGLLLFYTTTEDLTKPDEVDFTALLLIRLLHALIGANEDEPINPAVLPPRGVARKLFWRHLYPRREDRPIDAPSSRPIANTQTRGLLIEVILAVVKNDPTQYMWLLEDLDDLVPVYQNQDGDNYDYELPQQFDRSKALRAPCGYAGLRNLSNTCYFNSLLTQLFMNVDFREFILGARVRDRENSQCLLFATQKMFAFLQNSLRPFINPEECVANIKTYEDTQIDVVNQMDVDEFFNLLFDRWEGQFATSDEKNRFRVFFGGQLVQQVRSQECEHVSERLEPFSAIQCDIKGKSSLQESLQAYVDGEIMEGDNKYKCSTCDRHVDAVKRACLKDIPDNLIFHLKRFDFNLRTMQRNKINDYFAFPEKIDMRPYTIEHLSSPNEEQSEDIFELVGVLVHTGTAESGHYYSYIRERPTNGEGQTWVEFNDETVTPWDPATMASACFGGPDYPSPFPSGNGVFEKQYSAYMLFYQRSSSLAKNQARLQQPGASVPLAVDMPADIEDFIQGENDWLLRRQCLFDPCQIQFVILVLGHLGTLHQGRCSQEHHMETQALTMALSHLDQVASRAKELHDFVSLVERIQDMCRTCVRCSLAAFNYFRKHPFTLRMLVQKNLDEDVRRTTAALFIRVLEVIKDQEPAEYGLPPTEGDDDDDRVRIEPHQTVLAGVVRILENLWTTFHLTLRSWPEVFELMLSFVSMGRHELAAFLQHPHFLKWLLWIIWADASAEPLLPPQFAKMVAIVSKRLPNRQPSYESIIALLDHILGNIRFTYNSTDGRPIGAANAKERVRLAADPGHSFPLTRNETEILHFTGPRHIPVNVFVDRLISIAQNPEATESLLEKLIKRSRHLEHGMYQTLMHRITGQVTHHKVAPYLRVAATTFCRVASDAGMVKDLLKHVARQCTPMLQNNEGRAFLEFMRATFDGPRQGTGESALDVTLESLNNVLIWAPALLGYPDASVSTETENFLHDKLLRFRDFRPASSGGDEPDDERELSQARFLAARALGMQCLVHLQENYVHRGAEVTERAVGALQRVIKACARYYHLDDPEQDEEAQDFAQLNQSVMDSISSLMVVGDVDEDGSDWEGSSIGSGKLDGFEDMTNEALQSEDL